MKRLKTVKETKEILKGFSLKAQNLKATKIKNIILNDLKEW